MTFEHIIPQTKMPIIFYDIYQNNFPRFDKQIDSYLRDETKRDSFNAFVRHRRLFANRIYAYQNGDWQVSEH